MERERERGSQVGDKNAIRKASHYERISATKVKEFYPKNYLLQCAVVRIEKRKEERLDFLRDAKVISRKVRRAAVGRWPSATRAIPRMLSLRGK